MKPNQTQTKLTWPTERPTPSEASRIVAWVAMASATVFGLVISGLYNSVIDFDSWGDVLICATFVHSVIQAGVSFYSWKTGAAVGLFTLSMIFLFAIWWIAFLDDFKSLSWLVVSGIVSATAVTIYLRETHAKNVN